MPADPFSAVWVSHSSMSDFIKCPRAYYLKNVYKDPKTRHKITIMAPALALGQAVHEVIENLSTIPTADRFKVSLIERYENIWPKVSGKKGGFSSPNQEAEYKERGAAMLRRVMNHPGPVQNLAVKINMDLPHYWLSPEDEIILCGKIDWLQYHPETDSVTILDFKTGKGEEDENSLQLPIYRLLVANTQKRQVDGAFYWYLDREDELTPKDLPDIHEAHRQVLDVAKKIKVARKLNVMKCPKGDDGCFACRPFESVLRGEAELVGTNEYRADVYIISRSNPPSPDQSDSVVL